MAEKANDPDVRLRLIELSREWMHAAIVEERRTLGSNDATWKS
jgi:hypothetical protein